MKTVGTQPILPLGAPAAGGRDWPFSADLCEWASRAASGSYLRRSCRIGLCLHVHVHVHVLFIKEEQKEQTIRSRMMTVRSL